MEYTKEFTNLRKEVMIEYLEYKRRFLKNENELNIIDLKLSELTKCDITNSDLEANEHLNFLKKITGDFSKYSLYRPWNRLTKEQKDNQLKLFLNSLINADNLDEIKNLLISYNNNGSLSNKYVTYDSKLAKIVSIKTLEYDNNSNTYNIQINLKKTLSI